MDICTHGWIPSHPPLPEAQQTQLPSEEDAPVPQPSLDPLQELHIPAQEIWGPVRSRHQEGEARKAMECGDEENFKKEQQKGRKEVGKDK